MAHAHVPSELCQAVASSLSVNLGDVHFGNAAQELAWASYSLLRNTNSTGLLVADSTGSVQVVRGAMKQPASPQQGTSALQAVQQVRGSLLKGMTEATCCWTERTGPIFHLGSAPGACHGGDVQALMFS